MIQLRVKTEYSFGRTFAPIGRIVQWGKEHGCTAMGIVDNNTWGHVPFYKACKAAGIQPLLGISICVSDEEMETHMWFLVLNQEGLKELYKTVSKAHHQSLKTKRGSMPRLYRSDVTKMSANILKFAGQVTDGAFLKKVKAYIDLSPESQILNAKKLQLADKYKLLIVSTSDNAFAYPDDADTFELMGSKGLKTTPQYLLPELEHQDVAEAIAKKCDVTLPKAPMLYAEGDLEALCREGIKRRKMNWTQQYEERLNYELDLIKSKDFVSYFIVVADMVRFAKEHMLVGPSRGSAAGSLVCYLARITEIDPIPANLFFERFIDVSRTDYPDIDLDFPDTKRHLVFEYMAKKYGTSNVAHIGTISKFRPRSALIQVCKALGIPPSVTAAVKMVIFERSMADARANKCLQDTFAETTPGQEFIKEYPQAAVAALLENHASHTGIHAAGLLVCDDEITNYCVVDDRDIAHIEIYAAETLGLLKIDVLGLRTLGILEDSGAPIDWYNLTWDDQATFDIFNSGRLCGIFQFDGDALRSISSFIKFSSIDHIDVVTALARPGPFGSGVTHSYIRRMNGEKYEAMHPLVEPHMSHTFGLPIYQEQILSIVRHIGDFDWAETSSVRRGISKRMGKDYFQQYAEKFHSNAMAKGLSDEEATQVWTMINSMGAWQMNKAHTFSYAVISYWTAYLKAHFPLQFAAATLRSAKDEDHAIMLLREMHNEGVEYVPFDLERSEANWSVKDGKLYGGFVALRGIGEVKAAKLVEARNAGTLTPKQIEQIRVAENQFDNIFPFHTHYQDMYDHPEKYGITSPIHDIKDVNKQGDVPHNNTRVFMGEIIRKSPRNANETVLIKKRGGIVFTGPLDYVDVYLRDDTGIMGGRVGRYDFQRIGKELQERIPVGAHILVRAKFYTREGEKENIPWAFIQKWKVIGDEA